MNWPAFRERTVAKQKNVNFFGGKITFGCKIYDTFIVIAISYYTMCISQRTACTAKYNILADYLSSMHFYTCNVFGETLCLLPHKRSRNSKLLQCQKSSGQSERRPSLIKLCWWDGNIKYKIFPVAEQMAHYLEVLCWLWT